MTSAPTSVVAGTEPGFTEPRHQRSASTVPLHCTSPNCSRTGITLLEALIAVGILGLMCALLFPAIVGARERARLRQCTNNLRQIGLAFRQYHEAFGVLPAAAVWRPPASLRDLSLLSQYKRIDLVTYENWAQLLLPHLGQQKLVTAFDRLQPVMSGVNALAAVESLPCFVCPTDEYSRPDAAYLYQPFEDSEKPIAVLARGNYAINGGTHNHRITPESAAQPHGDGLKIVADARQREYRLVGTGVAGINRAFKLRDFINGESTLVAAEEIRAGIHPLDPRGVWALGQIGGSITWAHGISGDDCGPNNQWERADDIFGCGRLHDILGSATLMRERMPCVPYVDFNDQATARSLHPNGVNVLFVDGSVRFVHDNIDKGLWHVMHSRETPRLILESILESHVGSHTPSPDLVPVDASVMSIAPTPGATFSNSIRMEFVAVPSGDFTMGIPDGGNNSDPPPESPAHKVQITRSFWLGRHEVTQAQFGAVLAVNPSLHTPDVVGADTNAFPVERVSWYDAVEYCRKLSELPEENAAKRVYRLPTEAEWEFGCRGGQSVAYPWQRNRRRDDNSGENAGIVPSLPLSNVGSYAANSFGLYDMRGNVWEWCADWFDRTYYSRSPISDPRGPANGFLKVVRGGDWIFVGELCRINYPIMPPWKMSPYVGFRVVCEVRKD